MNFLEEIKNKRVHVIGIAGQEGRAVLEFLLESKLENLFGHEDTPEEKFRERFLNYSDAYTPEESEKLLEKILSSSAKLYFEDQYLTDIQNGDLVITPQSYRRYSKNQILLNRFQKGEIVLKQAIELVFEISPCPIIGITGTVGKSTISALIAHILKKAGKKIYFSGNDREDKWDFISLSKLNKKDLTVLEISNRHLFDLKVSPHVAVISNLHPHHLDDHGDFKKYLETKKKIFLFQKKNDFAILNNDLFERGQVWQSEIPGICWRFSLADKSNGFVRDGSLHLNKDGEMVELVKTSSLTLKGDHYLENCLAASLACWAVRISPQAIKEGLLSFSGLRFRQEFVGSYAGRKVYNDGKATDPIATVEAVKAIEKISVLLLGGIREGYKKGDFSSLAETIKKKEVEKIIIFGKNGPEILEELASKIKKEKLFKTETLQEAVKRAHSLSKQGETIVFSPSCQSFDEFTDYRERARKFEELVKLW